MKNLFVAVRVFVVLTFITGVLYPLLVTGLGQLMFPFQAQGSLIELNGRLVGSQLIAQKFTQARYFWPRPSAVDYATVASGASNMAPTNPSLRQLVEQRKEDGFSQEMLFASGSGLDPHISPDSALNQVRRISEARSLSAPQSVLVENLIREYTEDHQGGLLGEKRVNVLLLNLALDEKL